MRRRRFSKRLLPSPDPKGLSPRRRLSHAIRAVIDLARETKEPRVIVFNLSGHGFLDLASYDKYLAGELVDYHLPVHAIENALKDLPHLPNR